MPYLAKECAASKVYAKEFKAWHKKTRAETIARHKETQAKTRQFEKGMRKGRAETVARHKESQAKTRKFEKDMAA